MSIHPVPEGQFSRELQVSEYMKLPTQHGGLCLSDALPSWGAYFSLNTPVSGSHKCISMNTIGQTILPTTHPLLLSRYKTQELKSRHQKRADADQRQLLDVVIRTSHILLIAPSRPINRVIVNSV